MESVVWLQKWSKGKQKEKVNNAVLFDQATYDKLITEVPKYKQITPSVLSERLRVTPLLPISLHELPLCSESVYDAWSRRMFLFFWEHLPTSCYSYMKEHPTHVL
jgi:hypothetical protein